MTRLAVHLPVEQPFQEEDLLRVQARPVAALAAQPADVVAQLRGGAEQLLPLPLAQGSEPLRDAQVRLEELHAVDADDQRGDRQAQGVADGGGGVTVQVPVGQGLHAQHADPLGPAQRAGAPLPAGGS